jgi:hypothetical protein
MTGGPNFGVLVCCHEDNPLSKLWLIRFLAENGQSLPGIPKIQ